MQHGFVDVDVISLRLQFAFVARRFAEYADQHEHVSPSLRH